MSNTFTYAMVSLACAVSATSLLMVLFRPTPTGVLSRGDQEIMTELKNELFEFRKLDSSLRIELNDSKKQISTIRSDLAEVKNDTAIAIRHFEGALRISGEPPPRILAPASPSPIPSPIGKSIEQRLDETYSMTIGPSGAVEVAAFLNTVTKIPISFSKTIVESDLVFTYYPFGKSLRFICDELGRQSKSHWKIVDGAIHFYITKP